MIMRQEGKTQTWYEGWVILKKDTSRKSIKKIIAKYYSVYNVYETDIENADNGRRKRIVD